MEEAGSSFQGVRESSRVATGSLRADPLEGSVRTSSAAIRKSK